jgi:ABC-type glycerol-3-phosphate transport system permease component
VTTTPVRGSTRQAPRRRKARGHAADRVLPVWAVRLLVTVLLVITIVPVAFMLLISLTPDAKAALGTVDFAQLTLRNYVSMWSSAPLAAGLEHTIIIAGVSAAVSVLLGFLAAYPLARFTFRGRNTFLYTLIGTQTIPQTTLLLPLFVVFSWIQTSLGIHLIGGYLAPIITYMTFGLPMCTWFLFTYVRVVPGVLDEAATLDGCSRAGVLFRIVFPIARPAIVVSFVFAFLVGWNDVLFASVLTNASTQTLSLVMVQLANAEGGTGLPLYGQLMAGAVVSSVPVILLYLVFQRHLVQGLSGGAVAGA